MLSVENISYEIKKHRLLHNVSFSLHPGEMIAVLGANGAGKSTLIKLLNGEYRPSTGVIRLEGKALEAYGLKLLATKRATMSQQQGMSMDFPVREVVMMGRYPHYTNQPGPRDWEVVEETMSVCGLDHLAERTILTLSGGEQQRVHLARVLAQLWDGEGGLLLMDELTSAMDIQFQHQTLAIARALADRRFMVVTVLHDMNLAAQYADRLILLKNGRKMHDGTPAEVLNARNIYQIFSIDSQVSINPTNLSTQVLALPMKIDLGAYGRLSSAGNTSQSLETERGFILGR